MLLRLLAAVAGLGSLAVAQDSTDNGSNHRNLTVDLGYAVYQGVLNSTIGLQSWKGIRYAAAPTGSLRWQAPRTPPVNRTLQVADTFGSRCPQALNAGSLYPFQFPAVEDCLFLNVYSPTTTGPPAAAASAAGSDSAQGGQGGGGNGRLLPVMFYIHGGGYGIGDGTLDMTTWLGSTGNDVVIVAIQYRLGAFGFLSSAEVKSRGVLNAGLLDMTFALDWVQQHVSKFGGDPDQVTLVGDSAGGGAGLLLATAQDGAWGTSRFKQIIAASPYVATQPTYDSALTTSRYYTFSAASGCPSSGEVFDCLVAADFMTLELVNYNISNFDPTVPYGSWTFIPVTDGSFLTGLPSQKLASGRVNGEAVLTSNNADEGPAFVPGNITTQPQLVSWLETQYPTLTSGDIAQLLAAYPSPNVPDNPNSPKMETNGLTPPTAVNVSQVATGHQQRAYDMYAESTFACPSYWLATAFEGRGRVSYRYQYSIPFAIHSYDWESQFGPPFQNQPPEFNNAFRLMFANFIYTGNPSIPRRIANGPSSPNPNAPNPASAWPVWTGNQPTHLVLNTTGGTPYTTPSFIGIPVIQYEEPGLLNKFTAANAYTWEGGRGQRCDLWKALGPRVPE